MLLLDSSALEENGHLETEIVSREGIWGKLYQSPSRGGIGADPTGCDGSFSFTYNSLRGIWS